MFVAYYLYNFLLNKKEKKMKNLILRTVVTMSLSQGIFAAGELSAEEQRLEDFRRDANSIVECAKDHVGDIVDHVELAKEEIEALAVSLKEDFEQILEDADFQSFKDSVEGELNRAKTELNRLLPEVKKEIDAAVDRLEEQANAAVDRLEEEAKQLADRLGVTQDDQRKAEEAVKAAAALAKAFGKRWF
jgi:chromosome segregation ATPase